MKRPSAAAAGPLARPCRAPATRPRANPDPRAQAVRPRSTATPDARAAARSPHPARRPALICHTTRSAARHPHAGPRVESRVSRQLATGGTASPNANGINPRTNKNRNNDRSSPTFPFAESTDSRSHSRNRNAVTCSPPRSVHPQLVRHAHPLAKKPRRERHVPRHRQRRQPAIADQPLPVRLDQLPQRRQRITPLRADHPPAHSDRSATTWIRARPPPRTGPSHGAPQRTPR